MLSSSAQLNIKPQNPVALAQCAPQGLTLLIMSSYLQATNFWVVIILRQLIKMSKNLHQSQQLHPIINLSNLLGLGIVYRPILNN
jgi:hypothetical protein